MIQSYEIIELTICPLHRIAFPALWRNQTFPQSEHQTCFSIKRPITKHFFHQPGKNWCLYGIFKKNYPWVVFCLRFLFPSRVAWTLTHFGRLGVDGTRLPQGKKLTVTSWKWWGNRPFDTFSHAGFSTALSRLRKEKEQNIKSSPYEPQNLKIDFCHSDQKCSSVGRFRDP